MVLTIYVKEANGDSLILNINNIKEVKEYIKNTKGIPPKYQQYVIREDDGHTKIADDNYKLIKDDILFLIPQSPNGDSNICNEAAKNGKLKVLKWAKENGCPWDNWTCAKACALHISLRSVEQVRQN